MYGTCKNCGKPFENQNDFITHSCVQESRKGPRSERLKRLYEGGGCSKEYYDAEMAKLGAANEPA